jgi:hypothetical protein
MHVHDCCGEDDDAYKHSWYIQPSDVRRLALHFTADTLLWRSLLLCADFTADKRTCDVTFLALL